MDAKNLLLIMADEFTSAHLGCAGHPLVKTPNLDKLAASGTRFRSAYTNSPLCIPARASFATGRYTHDIGYWDNAHPYDGRVPGWGHALQEEGHRVESIGKLHFRDADAPTGFDEQIVIVLPRHVAREVAEDSSAQEELEHYLQGRIEGGDELWGVYPPDEKTLAAYQAQRTS